MLSELSEDHFSHCGKQSLFTDHVVASCDGGKLWCLRDLQLKITFFLFIEKNGEPLFLHLCDLEQPCFIAY